MNENEIDEYWTRHTEIGRLPFAFIHRHARSHRDLA